MKNLAIVFVLGVLTIFACQKDDFLERPPLDALDAAAYWKTGKDLENYVAQFYAGLPGHGEWQNGYGYPIANADNAILGSPNNKLTGDKGTTSGRWTSDWRSIRAINIFFDNDDRVEDDFANYKQFVGEAHFFRAWFYWNLVKKYGDVAWYNTELNTSLTAELSRPRDPRTLVVDSILADLDKAASYLGSRAEAGNLRLNKESALTFKSRIALFEGSWQKYHANDPFGTPSADPNKYFQACINACEELFSGEYTIGLYEDYYELFGLDDMSQIEEVFLYRGYNILDVVRNDMQWTTIGHPAERGITWSLVSSYLDKSGVPIDYLGLASSVKGSPFLSSIAEQADPRLNASIWAPGDLMVARTGQVFEKPVIDGVGLDQNTTGFELKKGSNPSSPGAGKEGGGLSETGYIIFRYGEVLTNYAEALYEAKGEVAYDALNQLRTRAGMPEFTVIPQESDPNLIDYGYTISDELYEIRRERRVELALEGHREDDFRRWAAHALIVGQRPKGYPFDPAEFPDMSPALDENGRIDYFQQPLPNGYQFRPDQDYLNSIPLEELTLNPNLVQNPGW